MTVSRAAQNKLNVFIFAGLALLAPSARAFTCGAPTVELIQKTKAFTQRLNNYDNMSSTTDADVSAGCGQSTFNFKLDPWVRNYAPYSVGGDAQADHAFFDLKEAWIEGVFDNFDVRVGNQIVSWGTGDGINPTDVWNPSDLIDPFDSVKLPVALIKLSVHPLAADHIILDLLASPQFRPHRLPIDMEDARGDRRQVQPTDSRWLIQSPTVVRANSGVSLPVEYEVIGPSKPNDWQYGSRLRYMRLGGWDFSASFSQTTYQMPAISTRVQGTFGNPSLPVLISLIPRYYRITTVGGDVSGAIGTVGVRGEIAVRTPNEKNLDGVADRNTWATIGIDRSFFLGKTELYLNLIYVYEDGTSVTSDANQLSVPKFEPYDRNLVVTGELRFSQKAKLGLKSVSSLINQDGWLHPYAWLQVADWFGAEVGADFFLGSETGFFGQYGDNDRVTSSLTVNF